MPRPSSAARWIGCPRGGGTTRWWTARPPWACSPSTPWQRCARCWCRWENVRLAEGPSFGEPITRYDTRSTGAEDYRALAGEVLGQEAPTGGTIAARTGKRTTIGTNPLDGVIPVPAPGGDGISYPTPADPAAGAGAARVIKERLTVHLPVDQLDRVKNAVYWTPGLTLAALTERALAEAMIQLEAERGALYPPRREELKGGRPLK